MKKYLLYILLLLAGTQVFAQSNIRLANYWEDPHFINPASAHYAKLQLSLAGRAQWTGFPGAPYTGFFTATTWWEDLRSQFGLYAKVDKIGYTLSSEVALDYALVLPLTAYHAPYVSLNLGLSAKCQSLHYDTEKIQFEDGYPMDAPAYESLEDHVKPNADIGVELLIEQPKTGLFTIGVSSTNFVSLFDKSNDPFGNANFAYFTYHSRLRKDVDFSLGTSLINVSNIWQGEFMAAIHWNYASTDNERVSLAINYRTRYELGLALSVSFADAWKITYSYDYNMSAIQTSAYGTHELILRYRLDWKRDRCQWMGFEELKRNWYK